MYPQHCSAVGAGGLLMLCRDTAASPSRGGGHTELTCLHCTGLSTYIGYQDP